jgi:hypothetical protein
MIRRQNVKSFQLLHFQVSVQKLSYSCPNVSVSSSRVLHISAFTDTSGKCVSSAVAYEHPEDPVCEIEVVPLKFQLVLNVLGVHDGFS